MTSKKKLLILSGPMGTGHHLAGNALVEYSLRDDPDCEVIHINTKDLMPFTLRFIYGQFYYFILFYAPSIWREIYLSMDTPRDSQPLFGSFLKGMSIRFEKKLIEKVKEINPTEIICTHFIPTGILGRGKERGEIKTPLGCVITDFWSHWAYINTSIDHYFVPTNDIVLSLTLRGIDPKRISNTGCPIRLSFARNYSKISREDIAENLGLLPEKNYAMIMMGGDNIGDTVSPTSILLEQNPNLHVLVMLGNSHRSVNKFKLLKKLYKERLIFVHYTEKISEYMAISDFMLTKPGGLTVTEALAIQLPLVLINPLPGHEERNAVYLSTHGLAAVANHLSELSYIDFSPHASWLNLVRNNQKRYAQPEASRHILTIMKTLHQKDV